MKKFVSVLMISFFVTSCGSDKKVVEEKKDEHIIEKYAEILKVSKSEIENTKLYAFIDEWYGTKYKYGGMSKAGVDCSGFCNVLYNQVYKREIKRSTKELSNEINKVGRNKLKEGNLVFFNISGKKNSHVGVYLKNNMFVHSSTSKGVMISNLENPYYRKSYSKGGPI